MPHPGLDSGLRADVRRLCKRRTAYAEVWRAVGAAAERRGLAQPSYGWVRLLVRQERVEAAVKAARRELWSDVAADLARGLVLRPLFRVLEHMEGNAVRPSRPLSPSGPRGP